MYNVYGWKMFMPIDTEKKNLEDKNISYATFYPLSILQRNTFSGNLAIEMNAS